MPKLPLVRLTAAVRECGYGSSKAAILIEVSSISVVIPSYNDDAFLKRCLGALAAGTRQADEVIVVDNASTDATAATASAAGARVVTERSAGIWPAASAGYDAATCSLIARLDADSLPPADWLERIDAAFAAHPEISFLTGPGVFLDGSRLIKYIGDHWYVGGYFWAMGWWLGQRPVYGSNFAMRQCAWQALRGEVHRQVRAIHDDLDLSMHLHSDHLVLLERSLVVGVASRPLQSWRGLGRRLGWAVLTLALHWPEDSPWRMRRARRRVSQRS